MFDRLTLADDLRDCRGGLLARRGAVVSPETIAETARRTRPPPLRTLAESSLVDRVEDALRAPAHDALFRRGGAREAVEAALLGVRLPEVLFEELEAFEETAPGRGGHAFSTAAVAVRMLVASVGASRSRGLSELAAAALLHDLGMRHLPARLDVHAERLAPADALLVAAHPLLGACHLAAVLGAHPAVGAAHAHHWRCGQGYPALDRPPTRSVEVVAVASAFAALTQPRAFRSAPYDPRGAVDVLVNEAATRQADPTSVKLLVHALRGGAGDPRSLRFGVVRDGHAPAFNRHEPLAAPARSSL